MCCSAPQDGHRITVVPGAKAVCAPHDSHTKRIGATVAVAGATFGGVEEPGISDVIGEKLRAGSGWRQRRRYGTEQLRDLWDRSGRDPLGHALTPHQSLRRQFTAGYSCGQLGYLHRTNLLTVNTKE